MPTIDWNLQIPFFPRQTMYKLSYAHVGRCTQVHAIGCAAVAGSATETERFTRNPREEQKTTVMCLLCVLVRPDRLLCMYRGFVRVRLPRRRCCRPQPPIGRSAAVRYLVLATLSPVRPSSRTHYRSRAHRHTHVPVSEPPPFQI